MGSWENYRRVCMHGVREGIDDHDCPGCVALAKELNYKNPSGWLFLSDPRTREAPIAAETAVMTVDKSVLLELCDDWDKLADYLADTYASEAPRANTLRECSRSLKKLINL